MTRLLVSVRNATEAAVALEAGAHLIDVKEPARGSLGAADIDSLRAVCSLVANRVPISAALGELLQQMEAETISRASCVKYAKLGMAACAELANWQELWAHAIARFPATTSPVAVTYADWREAASPPPREMLPCASALGCRSMLVDTFDKAGGGLLDCMPRTELADFVDACRARGMMVVLAGSLSRRSIPSLLPLSVDYLAVRGAACIGGRQGRISGSRIRQLLHLLNSNPSSNPSACQAGVLP
jgi:uncharacterized protein (UPF0264 family)